MRAVAQILNQTSDLELFPSRKDGPGVNILPLITPLNEHGNPIQDAALLKRLLQHVASLGNQRLFLLGETGEFRFLRPEQRHAFVEAILPIAKELGMKTCVNLTYADRKLTEAEWIKYSEDSRVDALILAPAFKDNLSLLEDVLSGRLESTKPLVVYNNPGICDGKNIPHNLLKSAKGKIQAIKDSSGDLLEIAALRNCCHDIGAHFFIGSERLMMTCLNTNMFCMAVTSGAVAASGSMIQLESLYEDTCQKRRDKDPKIQEAIDILLCDRKKIVASLKYALSYLGIIDSPICANPNVVMLEETEKRRVQELADLLKANNFIV